MALPVLPPRRRRARHCYEGFVEKRGPRDEGYRRVWAGLRGLTLSFYEAPRDPQPLEALELGELLAVQAQGSRLSLRLPGQEVLLKAESPEAQELWRGFILTMVELQVPADLALLPGHMVQLAEALREEQERRAAPGPPGPPRPAAPPVPDCFYEVSRSEAERLLERSAGSGNMVLRPGGHGQGLSVTTRQALSGTALVKHYKVTRVGQEYVIDVETPHRCSSLAEVVAYFVENSKGSLRPLAREYTPRLEFVETDGENGERVRAVCKPPCPPAAPRGATTAPRGAPASQPRQPPASTLHAAARARVPVPRPASSPGPPAPRLPGAPARTPPAEPTYMNEQGAGAPQSSAPRVAPRPALPHPQDGSAGMVEELAKKLQARRALVGD
ncbi:signal-transducing adaptor protein 2 [Dromaius novaehollandiae]|uniref:signal-transducing adaptor protein 2 n=1 Tax=Dromaius novaehollandiae TaxID=8790 RepID=UPI00311E5AB4